MATLRPFREEKCPRCAQPTLHRLGEEHALSVPLEAGEKGVVTMAQFYVKMCRHCAYSELYSKYLVDKFQELDDRGGFGQVSKAPSGMYLLSIFVEYQNRGELAQDFTIPYTAEQWFALRMIVDAASDGDLFRAVFYGPYQEAWLTRVPKKPEDLVLRACLRTGRQDGRMAA
jgi:predicted nucleic-acid-binding Zn-ribbon protein